jgi:glutathione synthase
MWSGYSRYGFFSFFFFQLNSNNNFTEHILQVLHETSKTDTFVNKLIEILKRKENVETIRLHLIRQDYLPNYDKDNMIIPFQYFKAVEFNTIAVAFASFSEELARVHNRYNLTFKNSNRPLLSADFNLASKSYAAALARAHKLYTTSSSSSTDLPEVCFLVHENDHLDLDQELILRHLIRMGVRTFKACFETSNFEIRNLKGYKKKCLFVNARHVSVTYFHATWSPSQFNCEKDWSNRETIEMSSCIKVPTIASQLAGTKKVQEALSHRKTLIRFLKKLELDPDASLDISNEFAEILSMVRSDSALKMYKNMVQSTPLIDRLLDSTVMQIDPHQDSSSSDLIVQEALKCPEDWVLKPQREGGGNNLFGKDLHAALKGIHDSSSSSSSSKEYYTLMRKIKSKPQGPREYISKSGVPHHEQGISELGLFTTLLVVNDNEKKKKEEVMTSMGGAFCRTKHPDRDEGGVCSGNGFIDIPYFNSF